MRMIPGSSRAYQASRRAGWTMRVACEFVRFRKLSSSQRPALLPSWSERLLCVDDFTTQTPFDRHYVYHTAWAMRQLARNKPSEHVDISSSLYFVALASAIVPMRHYDYRPASLELDNLQCAGGDLQRLPFADDSVPSLSCMHVIEHIGLARYGDRLDPLGDAKAAAELARVLAPAGRLLFVTPVGQAKVRFNGHRIYSFQMVRDLFPSLEMTEWALVPDDPTRGLVTNASREMVDSQQYGCGCFVLRKRPWPTAAA